MLGARVGAIAVMQPLDAAGVCTDPRHVRILSKAEVEEEVSSTDMATDTAGMALSTPACLPRARRWPVGSWPFGAWKPWSGQQYRILCA